MSNLETSLNAAGPQELPPAIAACLDGEAPRASAFIVTLYGDVAEPRGGTLWMGTVIECCAAHGISESLARTAVSRLVGAGRLEGERNGRRSYYRLTAAAQAEFAEAARILPAWCRAGASWALAPNRDDVVLPAGVVLSAETVAGVERLPDLAARCWPLADVAADYRAFITAFAPVAEELDGLDPAGPSALALRLRLVHAYRHAALADPRLPGAALPGDWPAQAARRLFVRLYLALAEAADSQVGLGFHDAAGRLPVATESSHLRLDRLRRELARG